MQTAQMQRTRARLWAWCALVAVACCTAVLTACASTTPPTPEVAATPTAPPATTPPPVACPAQEGVTLPPECAPYDPEHAMAQNQSFRDRMEIGDDVRAQGSTFLAPVSESLEALRASGDVTPEDVNSALLNAGLASPQVTGAYPYLAFGAEVPAGACVFGEITAEGVRVDVGGYILDGGCLPAA